jgi:hypothetical protein
MHRHDDQPVVTSESTDTAKPHLMAIDPEKPSLVQLLRDGNAFARVQALVVLFLVVLATLTALH